MCYIGGDHVEIFLFFVAIVFLPRSDFLRKFPQLAFDLIKHNEDRRNAVCFPGDVEITKTARTDYLRQWTTGFGGIPPRLSIVYNLCGKWIQAGQTYVLDPDTPRNAHTWKLISEWAAKGHLPSQEQLLSADIFSLDEKTWSNLEDLASAGSKFATDIILRYPWKFTEKSRTYVEGLAEKGDSEAIKVICDINYILSTSGRAKYEKLAREGYENVQSSFIERLLYGSSGIERNLSKATKLIRMWSKTSQFWKERVYSGYLKGESPFTCDSAEAYRLAQ